jgi:hypothetical protein
MLVNGWLSWLMNRSGSQTSARGRSRDPVLQNGIRDWLLEDRCLLSGIVMPSNTVSMHDFADGKVLYNGDRFFSLIGPENSGTVPHLLNRPRQGEAAGWLPALFDAVFPGCRLYS